MVKRLQIHTPCSTVAHRRRFLNYSAMYEVVVERQRRHRRYRCLGLRSEVPGWWRWHWPTDSADPFKHEPVASYQKITLPVGTGYIAVSVVTVYLYIIAKYSTRHKLPRLSQAEAGEVVLRRFFN